MECVRCATSLLLLISIHGGVGASKGVLAGNEAFTASTGANWVILNGQIWVNFGDVRSPGGHGCFLRRGATTDEVTRGRNLVAATVSVSVVAAVVR